MENRWYLKILLLQPPYFDSEGDSASNYGSAGAGMAHEITHSFDELGNIYDAHSRSKLIRTRRAKYRSDTVRNVESWYQIYDVAPGDKLYLKPEDRVRIWKQRR